MAHGPDIIAVARETGRPLEDVAGAFFLGGERLRLDWLEARLGEVEAGSRWQRWAGQAMGDDLMAVRRAVARRILAESPEFPVEEAVDAYFAARAEGDERLGRLVDTIAQEGEVGLASLTVALRHVRALV